MSIPIWRRLRDHVQRTSGDYGRLTTSWRDVNGIGQFYRDLTSFPHPRAPLVCPNSVFEQTKMSSNPDAVDIVDYDSTSLTYRLSRKNASEVYMPIGTHTIGVEDLKTVAHDHVFSIFSENTDNTLSDYIYPMHDYDDHITPDLIFWPNMETCVVLEFSTTMSMLVESMQSMLHNKKEKYRFALEKRANAIRAQLSNTEPFRIIFIVLIVSTERVVSNYPLNQRLVDSLCNRMVTAISIKSVAVDSGLVIPEVADVEIMRQASALLSKIEPNYDPEGLPRGMTRSLFNNLHCGVADMTYVQKYYKESMLKARDDRAVNLEISPSERKLSQMSLIEEYKARSEGTRTDMKAIAQLPFIYLNECIGGPAYDLTVVDSEVNKTHYMREIWDHVLESDSLGKIKGGLVDLESLELKALQPPSEADIVESKKHRIEHRRLVVPIGLMQKVELAKLGLGKKHLKNDDRVQEYLKSKKECFSWKTPTDDVDKFMDYLSTTNMLSEVMEPRHLDSTFGLIDTAVRLHPRTKFSREDIMPYFRSKLYSITTWWSHVGVELTLSLQQNCRQNTYIYKKLKNYPVGILIKPTHGAGPIFFSLVFFKLDMNDWCDNTCFRKIINCGKYYCTEFSSYNRSRLINLVRLPMLMLALYPEWMAYDNLNILRSTPTVEVWRMMALSMLIITEDKAPTEEVFTQFRYLFMEKFVPTRCFPNTTKIIDRLPTHYRSRLALWASEKLLRCSMEPQYHPVSEGDSGAWLNMKNPYTGSTVTDPQVLLSLSYMGYLKFKSATSEANSDLQLITKMIESQNNMLKSDEKYFGTENREDFDYQFSEFSRSQVLVCAESYKRIAISRLGRDWQDVLDKEIKYDLGSQNWTDFATLKASSVYEPEQSMTLVDTKKVFTKRAKCINVVMEKFADLPDSPLEYVEDCIKHCESKGGIQADVFKKNQHGGTREIMVLSMESKILQKTIEIISRKLCSIIPFETLTHPRNKIKLPQEHSLKMNILKANNDTHNLSSSCDAKNWNHCHHVNKFALLLCAILPVQYHNLVTRILRLWKTKMIKYPDGILNLLIEKPETTLESPVFMQVRDAWTGKEPIDWLPVAANYMVIEVGMLQGILHYTSSLMHACLLKTRDDLFKDLFRSNACKAKVITMDLVSSDDSARIVDVVVERGQCPNQAVTFSTLDADAMKYFCKGMGIIESNKSTKNLPEILEFNSEFMLGPNLYRPRIKWIEAAINLTEVEGFVDRQQVMSTTLSELLEGGAPSFMVHIVQIAQALLHYSTLGNGLGMLFDSYAAKLNRKSDPSLGFFLMDHPYAAGYLGFKYNYWNAIQCCASLKSNMGYYLRDVEMTTTSSGVISRVALLKFGDRRAWQKMLRSAEEVTPNWKDLLNQDPKILYGSPIDKVSAGLKIMVKLTSPSVALALSSGVSLARVIASAVYCIANHSVSLSNAWLTDPGFEKTQDNKSSLMSLVSHEQSISVDLTPGQWSTLFPGEEEYSSVRELLDNYKDTGCVVSATTRRLRSTVVVFTGVDQEHCRLIDACKWKWFDISYPSSRTQRERIWAAYCETFPWLRETERETLIASPFDTSIQLANFVTSEMRTSRTIRLTAAPIKSVFAHDHLKEAIEENLWIKCKLDVGGRRKFTGANRMVRSLATHLTLLGNLNLKEYMVKRNLEAIFGAHDLTWSRNILCSNRRLRVLTAFKRFFELKSTGALREVMVGNKQMFRSELLIDDLLDAKSGLVGGFVRRQTYVETGGGFSWRGPGVWVGEINGVRLRIRLSDDIMIELETDSTSGLVSEFPGLKLFFSQMGWTHSNLVDDRAKLVYSDGRLTNDVLMPGTPVFQRNDIQTRLDTNYLPLNYEFTGGNLRLYYYQEEDGVKVTILNQRFREIDKICSMDCEVVNYPDEVCKLWFEGEPLTTRKVRESIRDLGYSREGSDTCTAWISIFREVLRSSLKETMMVAPAAMEEELEGEVAEMTLEDRLDLQMINRQLTSEIAAVSAWMRTELEMVEAPGISEVMRDLVSSQLDNAGTDFVAPDDDLSNQEIGNITALCRALDAFGGYQQPSTLKSSALTSRLLETYVTTLDKRLTNSQIRNLCEGIFTRSDMEDPFFVLYKEDFSIIYNKDFTERFIIANDDDI